MNVLLLDLCAYACLEIEETQKIRGDKVVRCIHRRTDGVLDRCAHVRRGTIDA